MKRNANYESENLVLSVPFIVKKTKKSYIAECLDLNIVTQGRTLKEAKENITEAINLHMKSASKLGILDNELEKLGVVRKKNKLEIPDSEIVRAPIRIPIS
ncbi:hypothetical protein HYX02_06705 [Candidatus Woesearchaeota archaeon]|nr:hypothetical protein [Candidatus Woesearchaeota archaeon]